MTIWLTSDPHFDHANTFLKFRRACPQCTFPGPTIAEEATVRCATCFGTREIPLRPFTSVDQMNDAIVDGINAYVKPSDHLYVLGDVAITKSGLGKVGRLRGHKRLVRGNHDIFKTKDYLQAGFREIHGCRVLHGVMLTHVPIHPGCLGRFKGNVHGHIHASVLPNVTPLPYLNVGVEALHYRPIALEEAIDALARVAPGWQHGSDRDIHKETT